jgi:hypothetical protein
MSTPSRVEIEAPVRLHLGLIAMGVGGPRINGGLGFAIEEPCLSVTAVTSRKIEVIDHRNGALGVLSAGNWKPCSVDHARKRGSSARCGSRLRAMPLRTEGLEPAPQYA